MTIKLSTLEVKAWEVLNPLLEAQESKLTPTHPKTLSDLTECKSAVVMGYLSDPVEGVIISQKILQPTYSFVIYSGEYFVTKKMQEFIIDLFNQQVKAYDFNTPEIRVNTISKLRRSPIVYTDGNEMYSAGVDYRFFIHSCL